MGTFAPTRSRLLLRLLPSRPRRLLGALGPLRLRHRLARLCASDSSTTCGTVDNHPHRGIWMDRAVLFFHVGTLPQAEHTNNGLISTGATSGRAGGCAFRP